MLAVPPAILDILNLRAGATVGMTAHDGRLVVEAQVRPSYTLDQLIAQCDPSADDPEGREWLDGPAVGRELI